MVNAEWFKALLQRADVLTTTGVSGSRAYLPYGWGLRNRIYGVATSELVRQGFQELYLPSLVSASDVERIDVIEPISQKYIATAVDGVRLTATHEAVFYPLLGRQLRSGSWRLPCRYFHIGPVYRRHRNVLFPFNAGERASFVECFAVTATREQAEEEARTAQRWAAHVVHQRLALPSVEVIRPISTNRHFSRQTVCIDALTPQGRTVNTAMTYLHDDLFTRAFNVRIRTSFGTRIFPSVVHFGLSDNLFYVSLLERCDDRGLRLMSEIAPIQVNVLALGSTEVIDRCTNQLSAFLVERQLRHKVRTVTQSELGRAIEHDIVRGVPITAVLYPRESRAGKIVLATREERIAIDCGSLETIERLLVANDEHLRQAADRRLNDAIVPCRSPDEAGVVVGSGRIAEVPLDTSDDSVRSVEQRVRVGEVLGFRKGETATDVLSGRPTCWRALISRRV